MSKMLLALSPLANITQDIWSATFLHIPVEEGFISVAVQPCVVVWVEVMSISVLCIHLHAMKKVKQITMKQTNKPREKAECCVLIGLSFITNCTIEILSLL